MDLDLFMAILLYVLFLYMWSFGLFGLFLYTSLLIKFFSKKADNDYVGKSLGILSNIGIFPSLLLFLFMIMGLFTSWTWDIPFLFLYTKNKDDFFYGITFSLLWWMPALFLPIKRYFNQHKIYQKLGLLWYGMVMICLVYQIYALTSDLIKK